MNTITGIDGTNYSTDEISYDPSAHSFFTNDGTDVTYNIHNDDMFHFAGFVQDDFLRAQSFRAHNQNYKAELPTNTTGIFLKQIVTDPLDAPIAALPHIGKGITDIAKTIEKDVLILAVLGIAAVFGYFVLTHRK